MSRPKPPITSFGPQLLGALIKGSKEPIVLTLSYREASVMRRRLYELRNRLREEKHELAPIVENVRIFIEWGPSINFPTIEERVSSKSVRSPRNPNATVRLTIRPADSEFREALQRAGVDAHELTDDPVTQDEFADVLSKYLAEVKESP